MIVPRAAVLGILLALGAAPARAQSSGDALCGTKSTPDACVISGNFTVTDGSTLTFSRPNVVVRGTLTVAFAGVCSLEPATSCVSDAKCTAPARCLRTGRITIQAAGTLGVDTTGQILARSQGIVGDVVGPDGGSITLVAHDVSVAGTLGVSAEAPAGVTAGRGGTIVLQAEGAATVAPSGRLDASTARGGCGGTITATGALTLAAGGVFNVAGATRGGTIDVGARDYVSASATFEASNTNSDQSTRPACPDGRGGGHIWIQGGLVEFTGAAKAEGRQGFGGVVRLEGVRGVTVDSGVGAIPIDVSGGEAIAIATGGGVFLVATGGDVAVRRGGIDADGLGTGLGSDAGKFSIRATGASRCVDDDAPCTSDADCGGDSCRETGGNVVVATPVSATGGAGLGFGCAYCDIRGTGTVSVTGPVAVNGGRQSTAGKVTISAGSDLTVGPGTVSADAGHGGNVNLLAGERAGAARDVSGVLHVVDGTAVRATALLDGGFGGRVELDGCEVHIDPQAAIGADGGPAGHSDGIGVVAHNALDVESLATFSALPDGEIAIAYRGTATVAPDATFTPPTTPVADPTIPACPACGNGLTEPLEECDGVGTCALASAVCLPPGIADQCTCRDTCGTVPGVQTGEECDGDDLGGATCVTLGFPGGTLACRADCTLDTTGCTPDVCGDGVLGPGEACDPGGIDGAPASFGDETCATRGFPAGGTLACTGGCDAVVTQPHCAGSVATRCTTGADCSGGDACVGGCRQCGNGFLDDGEECDDGDANGSGPDQCRPTCERPRCGDGVRDAGEECDVGVAACGAACRCDCTLPAQSCGECDDGDPCTADTCDAVAGCVHAPLPDGTPCADGTVCNGEETCRGGMCVAGVAPRCDDGDGCTEDGCDAITGCTHERVGYAAVAAAVEAGFVLPDCVGAHVPATIGRLLGRARVLLERASRAADDQAATRLVRRAVGKLRKAFQIARRATRRLPAPCATPLRTVIGDAVSRAECLLP